LTPLSFGVAPFLKELNLICGASVHHQGFDLSKVLRDTTVIHNLTLNFRGEKVNSHSFSCTVVWVYLADLINKKYQTVHIFEHDMENILTN
jgi:hypothetical protein